MFFSMIDQVILVIILIITFSVLVIYRKFENKEWKEKLKNVLRKLEEPTKWFILLPLIFLLGINIVILCADKKNLIIESEMS